MVVGAKWVPDDIRDLFDDLSGREIGLRAAGQVDVAFDVSDEPLVQRLNSRKFQYGESGRGRAGPVGARARRAAIRRQGMLHAAQNHRQQCQIGLVIVAQMVTEKVHHRLHAS